MFLSSFFLFLILKGILADENATDTRHGIQLWRAQGDFDEDVLEEFERRAHFTEEIWKKDNKTIDFVVYESEEESLNRFLDGNNVTTKILIKDVQGKVDEDVLNSFPTRRKAVSGDSFSWTGYPTLDEINRYLEKMAATYPHHCKLVRIGRTFENRPINMLKMSDDRKGTPAILVDGGIHGHEKTSTLSTLYFIDSIVRDYTVQSLYVTLRDWHIIPVLNPDGYEYSRTEDHLWKKNRRKTTGKCIGVDLNANFDYQWGLQKTSSSACGHDYWGPTPFSEAETKAFKSLVESTRYHGYISIHSAGARITYPTGSTDYDIGRHIQLTKEIKQAMTKVNNFHYSNDNARFPKKYRMSIDWMYHFMQIQQSYMIHTRGYAASDILESTDILPVVKEVRAGLLKFAEVLK